MLAKTADVDEAAARTARPVDQPRADQGDDGASAKKRSDDGERDHGRGFGSCSSGVGENVAWLDTTAIKPRETVPGDYVKIKAIYDRNAFEA